MMFPFGFGFVLGVAAAFLKFPDDDCLPDAGAGLLGFVLIGAMFEGFEGGGIWSMLSLEMVTGLPLVASESRGACGTLGWHLHV
jgi:hypothetical protein